MAITWTGIFCTPILQSRRSTGYVITTRTDLSYQFDTNHPSAPASGRSLLYIHQTVQQYVRTCVGGKHLHQR